MPQLENTVSLTIVRLGEAVPVVFFRAGSMSFFFAIPGLVLVRDAVWHVVVCSQYRHDRGGL